MTPPGIGVHDKYCRNLAKTIASKQIYVFLIEYQNGSISVSWHT